MISIYRQERVVTGRRKGERNGNGSSRPGKPSGMGDRNVLHKTMTSRREFTLAGFEDAMDLE